MDFQIKYEFPSFSSSNLTGVFDHLLTSNPNLLPPDLKEITFRFKQRDITFKRNGDFWVPALSYAKSKNIVNHCELPPKPIQNISLDNSSALSDYQNEKLITLDIPQWVQDSCLSIKNGFMKLCPSGIGGTYFVFQSQNNSNSSKIASVFKPIDEEPGAPNNPKKLNVVPMMEWGTGAHREVAAFKLDKGFSGVPETHMVKVTIGEEIKEGSLQMFMPNDGDCSDVGASKFSVDNIHRIGIFDIRILNMDRNDENLLVVKSNESQWKLIPIDHTYSFPKKINSYFNWQYWAQTKKPFSDESLEYIQQINVMDDALMLLNNQIDEESVRNVIGSTLLLQKSAAKGYTLFQIASMVSGTQNHLVSLLEKVKEKEDRITKVEIPNSVAIENRLNTFKIIAEEAIDEFLKTKK